MTAAYYFTLPFTRNNIHFSYIRFLGHSIQHKERIGSYTCPLAVTPPSWSKFLPVRHFCHPERSVVHSSGKIRVAEPFILCRTLVPIMTAAYGQPEKILISCGFTRLDLFTSTCFCLSWCVTASVISGANGFWLRSILNPPTAKADRAENRIRRYKGEPAYRLPQQSVYRLVVVQ